MEVLSSQFNGFVYQETYLLVRGEEEEDEDEDEDDDVDEEEEEEGGKE